MNRLIKSAIFISLSFLTLITSAQVYDLASSGNKGVITGTSSLHDWKMDITKFNSGFKLIRDGNSVKTIENVTFSCRAKDIKSESSLMDKKAYDALKTNEYPEINFTGSSVSGLTTDGNRIIGTLEGNLSLAGQSHEISVPFNGTLKGDGITIDSSAEITFSGFGLEPPTAMLGTLKTGDRMRVTFNLQFNQKGQ